MKLLYYFFIFFSLFFASCTTFKSIKCGSPSTDTYRNFAVDTIAALDNAKNVLISSVEHNKYFEDSKFNGGRFNSETIGEYFARVRGNGALLIVTILFFLNSIMEISRNYPLQIYSLSQKQ